jgi:hypothetical protein
MRLPQLLSLLLLLAPAAPLRAAPQGCDRPISWRVGEVDGRLGLERAEVEEAVRRATILWEDASRRILFRVAPPSEEAHLVVNLRFSPAQQLPLALEPGADVYRIYLDPLDRWRSDLAVLRIDLEQRMEVHVGRTESLDRRLASHNRQVESWNERGGAPAEVVARLEELGVQLARERDVLNDSARVLNIAQAAWAEENRAREAAVARYNQALETEWSSDSAPPFPVRSDPGSPGDPGSRTTIEVERFAGWVDFTTLVAHHLGRLLGVTPSDDPGALMNPQTLLAPSTAGVPPVRPNERDRVMESCPLP